MLGTVFPVDKYWVHRLVHCEVDFTHRRIRFYALRRRDPNDQPLLRELSYRRADKPFRGTPRCLRDPKVLQTHMTEGARH